VSHIYIHVFKAVSSHETINKILNAFPFSTTCITWPTHLIFLDLIAQIILGKDCKLQYSSLCNSLHPPAPSYLLSPNIVLIKTSKCRSNTAAEAPADSLLPLPSLQCYGGNLASKRMREDKGSWGMQDNDL
jgi:hypothetical protein